MSQPIVLIIFYCRDGQTERLALEAAVGAVQARGLIRLRRLIDTDAGGDSEDLLRMRKEYVPPAERDILAANAVLLVDSETAPLNSAVWQPVQDVLSGLRSAGKLDKIDVSILSSSAAVPLETGRTLVETVRSRKQT